VSAGTPPVVIADIRAALAAQPCERLTWPGFAHAAILVPVLDPPEGPALLFTVRAIHLARHAGQIAFPGGRLEPGEDAVAAALRETREEVGLDVPREDVLGTLDDHPSPYRLIATPVVARVAWPATLELQDSEVETTFVVALATLRATTPSWEERVTHGITRRLHRYDVDGRSIWGLTGNVVRDLLRRIDAVVGTGAS
jgi:8-oxo-dGTP pyrophosphatase MutT (NUDIX family)